MFDFYNYLPNSRIKTAKNLVVQEDKDIQHNTVIFINGVDPSIINDNPFYPTAFRSFYQDLMLTDYTTNKSIRTNRADYLTIPKLTN